MHCMVQSALHGAISTEDAELIRVCNANTMIVRLVIVPELPIILKSLGSVISMVYLWCCNSNL